MVRCEACGAPIDTGEWPIVTTVDDAGGRRTVYFCDDACYGRWRSGWEFHVPITPT